MAEKARHVAVVRPRPDMNRNTAGASSPPFLGGTPRDLDPTADSPLWMVTHEPSLNRFVLQLHQLRLALQQRPHERHELHVSRAELEAVRTAFTHMIRQGEATLHQLAQLLCATFLTNVQRQSVVIGEVESTHERFTLSQPLTVADLYATPDIDLGTRQLNKLQFWDGQGWSKALLVANVVDYQPTEANAQGIHRLSTRIKAEEEIWNKVVDELFDLDSLVQKDKKLRHLSRYVKDIFGLKIVVGTAADVNRVHHALTELTWPDAMLEAVRCTPDAATRRLEVLEVKDYLNHGQRKRSGWQALKSVVRWSDKTIELQIQPLRNFLHERELLTRESHLSFKAQREQIRHQVAAQLPLFRFYQDLLHWLFRDPNAAAPSHPGVDIRLHD